MTCQKDGAEMISDEERREVARKLRIQLQYMRKNKEYENDNDIVKCGNLTYRNIAWSVEPFGNLEPGNYIHIVDRLADLIDRPTTHVSVNEHGRAYCINCGCDDWCLADGSRYCPNCGAEVTND